MKKFLKKNKSWLLVFITVGVISNIFILPLTGDWFILILLGLWSLAVISLRTNSKISFRNGIILVVTSCFLLIFKRESFAERAAIWAYLFFAVGTFQEIFSALLAKKMKKNE